MDSKAQEAPASPPTETLSGKVLTMRKLNTLVAIVSLLAAGSSFAQSPTREQVVAELQRARASGELAAMNSEDTASFGQVPVAKRPVLAEDKSTKPEAAKAANSTAPAKTRAEVVAELKRARETGELEALHSEGGPGYFPVSRSMLPSEPVLAGKVNAKLN